MMDVLEQVKRNFNDRNRINQDLASYAVIEDKANHDPYEAHREDLILQEIKAQAPKRVLDLGCGIGHLVLKLLQNDIDCEGIDISQGMIDAGKTLLSQQQQPEDKLKCTDILTYQHTRPFDVVVANGVIWYYEDKNPFVKKMHDVLNSGGVAFVVHRNLLFNLFALNQGTLDTFAQHFFTSLNEDEKKSLSEQILTDTPQLTNPVKTDGGLKKPYDNPLTIQELYQPHGFEVEETFYTYIHPKPPRYNIKLSDQTIAQAQSKFAKNWAGLFMGSQFIVKVKKL